jgi:pimeloyl-ACP methyl ester carboxylesterase
MRFLLILSCALLLWNCSKTEVDLQKVDETIYVRSNKADMPVHIFGNVASNTIILMLHGGPGGSGLEYRGGKYAEYLEQQYGVAYWDQRGQGMSHGSFNNKLITVDNMVIDTKAVINALKERYGAHRQIIVHGHSWGGLLSAKFMITENNQHMVAGWIEANGAHDMPQLNIDAVNKFIAEADSQIALGNHVKEWQEVKTWAEAIDTNNITDDDSGEINKRAHEVEKWLVADGYIQEGEAGGIKYKYLTGPNNPLVSLTTGVQTNVKLQDEVEATSLTHELRKVTIPTLVISGLYDFVVPPTLAIDCYNNISSVNKTLVILEKSGHSPMNAEWKKYCGAIDRFIDSL